MRDPTRLQAPLILRAAYATQTDNHEIEREVKSKLIFIVRVIASRL